MFSINRPFFISLLTICFLVTLPSALIAYTAAERKAFQRSIVDSSWQLNPKFKKIIRKKTKYLIIHTSESNLKSALRTISKGKKLLVLEDHGGTCPLFDSKSWSYLPYP